MTWSLCMNVVGGLLSIYVLAESIDAIRNMCGGLSNFCHKNKYVAACGAAFWIIGLACVLEVSRLHLLLIGTIALFCWPRTVWRLRRTYLWLAIPDMLWRIRQSMPWLDKRQ